MSASKAPVVRELPDGSFAVSFDEGCCVSWRKEGDTHIIRVHADAQGGFTVTELLGEELIFKPLTRN